MTRLTLERIFKEVDTACPEGKAWALAHEHRLATAWRTCPRGDWMLWLFDRTINQLPPAEELPYRRQLALCLIDTLRTLPGPSSDNDHQRWLNCLDSVEAWGKGYVDLARVTKAARNLGSGPASHAAYLAARSTRLQTTMAYYVPYFSANYICDQSTYPSQADREAAFAATLLDEARRVRSRLPWSVVGPLAAKAFPVASRW